MTYTRVFRISAAHFNDEGYPFWRQAQEKAAVQDWIAAYSSLLLAVKEIHGHNFRITCRITGEMPDDKWLIDDVVLTKVVEDWFCDNLSLNSDLLEAKRRATTENLVEGLINVILSFCPPCAMVEVEVEETPDVRAQSKRMA
jgi:6-pyruvoyl-tetrahydropterin synthase